MRKALEKDPLLYKAWSALVSRRTIWIDIYIYMYIYIYICICVYLYLYTYVAEGMPAGCAKFRWRMPGLQSHRSSFRAQSFRASVPRLASLVLFIIPGCGFQAR